MTPVYTPTPRDYAWTGDRFVPRWAAPLIFTAGLLWAAGFIVLHGLRLALACAIPARDGATPQSQIHEKG